MLLYNGKMESKNSGKQEKLRDSIMEYEIGSKMPYSRKQEIMRHGSKHPCNFRCYSNEVARVVKAERSEAPENFKKGQNRH